MRKLFFLFFYFIFICVYAQEKIQLNGTWKFALARTEQEANSLSKFYSSDFFNNRFKEIPVPSNWAVLGYEEPVYRGFNNNKASEGFYIRKFNVSRNVSSERVLLHFGGVWSSAEVWLNGKPIGRHDSGYTSFAFDVSKEINKGENILAVRVRQVTNEYKIDVYDDWTLGGIYRDVVLEFMPRKRYIDKVSFKTRFDSLYKNANLDIKVMVADRQKNTLPGNYPSPGEPYILGFNLEDDKGRLVASEKISVPAHISTGRETELSLRVNEPHQWNAENPYLYTLHVDLIEKEGVAHSYTEKVGFRQISTEGGIFRINGQAVKLRGVNRHDEYPTVGRATTEENWLKDLTLMKEANINYIRLSHYAPAKGFIELCDKIGIYVGEEVSLGGAGNMMNNPSNNGPILQRAYETVIRDINNPSIIYWSVGNEDALTSLHIAAIKLVKALDPTRPVLLPWRAEGWLPNEVDILAPHYWKPQEYDRLAGNSTRPIISTEYTHAYGVDGFGGLEARWKALTKHPSGAGAAIWMWADQGIWTPTKKPSNINDEIKQGDEHLRIDYAGWDGIVDSYRNPTRDYWEAKAVYAQVYPTISSLPFVEEQDTINVPIQNDFDFTNLRAIKIDWSIWADDDKISSGIDSIDGQPHSASTFKIHTTALKNINPDKTYFIRFRFKNDKGKEINCKTVELCLQNTVKTRQRKNSPIKVIDGKNVIVEVGETNFIFNSQTGLLTSANISNRNFIVGLRPIIWRPLDLCEKAAFGKDNLRKAVDLNHYKESIEYWIVKKFDSCIEINAIVNYTVDSLNRFHVSYRYIISTDGSLNVHYQIKPNVNIPWLPIVGMSLQTAPELNRIKWLGLGPYDAYPNKKSAPVLGLWKGSAGTPEVSGIKETRWIERDGSIGRLHISSIGYMEHDTITPDIIHILSGVFPRPEKGRMADDSTPQLATNGNNSFVGEFSLILDKDM